MLSRNQKSAETCEQDVTPDQRRKVSYLVVVWVLSVSFQSFVLCHLVITHVGKSPRKLAGKGARISSYLINSYSLNSAQHTIQYALKDSPLFLKVFPADYRGQY